MPDNAPRSALREALASMKREAINGLLRTLPEEASLQLQYFRAFRRFADLKNPRRFTEKMQVLKLRGGLAAHSDWIDKVIAKERVAAVLGDAWITPTLWHGPVLPPVEQRTWPTPYVIKANHGSGWYRHVVTDADKDWPAIEKDCERWMRQSWHPHLREHQYAGIAPQILVEERLGGTADVLPWDYKFRVFNGVAKQVSVTVGRQQDIALAIFDRDWNPLPFTIDMPMVTKALPKPDHYEEMLRAAELLARPFPFARIDFYDLPQGPRFGEVTLTPSSGFKAFDPDAWDFHTGDLLDLSGLPSG